MTNPITFDVGRIPSQLRESLLHGKAAAEIGWGTDGDFARCEDFLERHGVPARERPGECAELHKEATGFWPGKGRSHSHALEFATEASTGAMVALVPSEADAQRLAVKGGEDPAQMHCTLCYLGDAVQWSPAERLDMAASVARSVQHMGAIDGSVFSLAYFNPGDANDRPTALVYGVDGEGIARAHAAVRSAIGGYGLKIPDQHEPFAAHVTAAYTDNLSTHTKLVDRMGPIMFDRVRLAFGDDVIDIPINRANLDALTASMGAYSPITWRGPLAPIGSPTGDRRIFPPDTLTYQTFPAPLRWQEKGMPGHEGAVVVGRILGAMEGEWNGEPHIVGFGDFFNPDVIPEVNKAIALVAGGVAGPSVDLDTFTGTAVEFGGKTMLAVTEGRVRGATLVSIPAFADLRLELEYPADAAEATGAEPVDSVDDLVTPDASTEDPLGDAMELAAETETFAVNGTSWRSAPIAPRDAEFDADEAVARIEAYAGVGGDSPDEKKMSQCFLWVDPQGAPLDRNGYRLPWGDIIDGKPYLIYHAIYAAAALLEGGHGGLPNIPDADKARLRTVISQIYGKLATEFGDPNIQASWDKAAEKADNATKAGSMGIETYATGQPDEGLVASGYDGIHPPKAAFAQKKLDRKTPMTVVARDGYNEVYGHLADWDTCHMGAQIGQPGLCIKPPRSKRNYADFHVSSVLTAEGDTLRVGKLTIDTYHGSTRRGLTAAQVRAHYEHTGTEAAVGRVYEDEFGPVFFGVQVPDNNPALAQKIRRTPVSGHWHPIDGHLELVAALGVNRPAYPIVASGVALEADGPVVWFEDGVQAGLIASAGFSQEEIVQEFATEEVVPETDCGCGGTPDPKEERVARIMSYSPIPTPEQQAALRQRLAAHVKE